MLLTFYINYILKYYYRQKELILLNKTKFLIISYKYVVDVFFYFIVVSIKKFDLLKI